MSDAGLYVLWIHLPEGRRIRVGALGELAFERGLYAYVGSAQRGRTARVRRHLRREKAMRWHIDYFRAHGDAVALSYFDGDRKDECSLVEALAQAAGGVRAVRRFGDGDCGCGGHLLYFPQAQPPAAEAPAGGTNRKAETGRWKRLETGERPGV